MEALATISPESLILIHSQYTDHALVLSQASHLSQREIFELIDVHTPYYALQDVHLLKDNIVAARVAPESPIGFEKSPIPMAEACRHLAILGSVVCAIANPTKSKHYYLAHKGTFTRMSDKGWTPNRELTLIAECIYFEKRLAMAKACLIDEEKELICGIDVSFHVIPQRIFNKLFAHSYRDYLPTLTNPYAQKNKLFNLQFSDTKATASLGEVQESHCSGHFPNHPALPVAVLMGILIDLCIQFIQHSIHNQHIQVSIKACTLLAENLALAGESVNLVVQQESRTNEFFKLRAIAYAKEGKSVGDITTLIEIAQSESDSPHNE